MSSVAATVGVAGGLAYADHSAASTTSATGAAAAPATTAATTATTATTASRAGRAVTPPTTVATRAPTRYADGSYTGAAQFTRWGDVQVQVTIRAGRIVAVSMVQAPSDRRSAAINSRAEPVLEAEAVAAQSAGINAVSGATYTSRTYRTSLQSALDRAAQAAAGVA